MAPRLSRKAGLPPRKSAPALTWRSMRRMPTGVLTSDRITETDILDGRWDNAAVELWRVNWADTSQRVLLRRGAVGQIRRGAHGLRRRGRGRWRMCWARRSGGRFRRGAMPRLGDARCGIDLENAIYKGTGVVTDLLRDRAFMASGLAGFDAGWFTSGTLTWTSGANAGRVTEVLAHGLDWQHRHPDPAGSAGARHRRGRQLSSHARAATSASRPAAPSSPIPPTSGAFPTSPARMRCCAMPARTAAMKGTCCDRR